MRMKGILSDLKCMSTGSPQDCVPSPLLFILYTNKCRSRHDIRSTIKCPDDSVIVKKLQENESSHDPVIHDLVHWVVAALIFSVTADSFFLSK